MPRRQRLAVPLLAALAACGGVSQTDPAPPTCTVGEACAPLEPCRSGAVACASGSPVCVAGAALPDGTSCGADLVCGAGACVACAAGAPCDLPGDPCHPGTVACGTGAPTCVPGAPLADGAPCGVGWACRAGACIVAAGACADCHGSSANAAPPRAVSGATSGVRVGAHQAHVVENVRSLGYACTECHPGGQGLGHANGVVEVAWGPRATLGGVTPSPAAFDGSWEASPTCVNYCHGGHWASDSRYRGNLTTPSWTDGAAARACNACHRFPPISSGHSSVTIGTNCGVCHQGYDCARADDPACRVFRPDHVDGSALSADACQLCHGGLREPTFGTRGASDPYWGILSGAPPTDTTGATSSVKVGGHLAHLDPLGRGPQVLVPVRCRECHGAAVETYTWSHSGVPQAPTFADAVRARLGGVAATFTAGAAGVAGTCVTYCHGGSLTPAQRGTQTSWSWNTTTRATCASCHWAPPADAIHTTVSKPAPATACNPCHATVVDTSGGIVFSGSGTSSTTLHIDGVRQTTATCTSCHGRAGANPAPPVATRGSTATTNPKVGAHQAHLTGTRLRDAPLGCDACHTVPTGMNHASGAVELRWNTLAVNLAVVPTPASGVLSPAWESTPTCTNYCHGGFWLANPAYRGNATMPAWIGGRAAAQCDSCHLAPPRSAAHANPDTNCNACHSGYDCVPSNLAACTVNRPLHIGGRAD